MGAKVSTNTNKQKPTSVVITKPEDGVYKPQKAKNTPVLRARALVVSISYKGTTYSLHGTIPDGKLMIETLKTRDFKEKDKEILFMHDEFEKEDPRFPTDSNILRAMEWLLSDHTVEDFMKSEIVNFGKKRMRAGTLALFYYSGHGMQVPDKDGDEEDGKDEVLCTLTPEGIASMNGITDDKISQVFNAKCRKDCQILAITDCCHSGTVFDLKYVLKGQGSFKINKGYKDSPGNIMHVGACYDRQSAYEGYVAGASRNHGYLTFAFSEIFQKNKNKNLPVFNTDIMLKERMLKMVSRANQMPQISTGNSISAYSAIFPF